MARRPVWITDKTPSRVKPVAREPGIPARPRANVPDSRSICLDQPARSRAEELPVADEIRKDATRLIANVMRKVRGGEPLDGVAVETISIRIIESLARNRDALISLGRVREKDHYTFEHSINVAVLTAAFGRTLQLDKDALCEVTMGALLHDVGKVHTPDSILKKPGPLTDEEFARVRCHVNDGLEVLELVPGIPEITVQAVAEHHERYDGSGYPNGLSGQAFSQWGQMVALSDVYDAVTSDRCYRPGREPVDVLRELLKGADTQFEQAMVHRFIRCVGIYPVGTLVGLESGRLAVVIESPGDGLLFPVVRAFHDMERGCAIEPERIDLAGGQGDRIISCESPTKWSVSPSRFIREP